MTWVPGPASASMTHLGECDPGPGTHLRTRLGQRDLGPGIHLSKYDMGPETRLRKCDLGSRTRLRKCDLGKLECLLASRLIFYLFTNDLPVPQPTHQKIHDDFMKRRLPKLGHLLKTFSFVFFTSAFSPRELATSPVHGEYNAPCIPSGLSTM